MKILLAQSLGFNVQNWQLSTINNLESRLLEIWKSLGLGVNPPFTNSVNLNFEYRFAYSM